MIAQKAAPLILQLIAIGIGLVRLGHFKYIQKARVAQLVHKYLAVLQTGGRLPMSTRSLLGYKWIPTLTWGN